LELLTERTGEAAANSVNGSIQAKPSLNASREQVNEIRQMSGYKSAPF
jgi:hypothetical protein